MLQRRLMVGTLAVWCVLGAVSTLAALTGPNMWWNRRDAPPFDVIGIPLRGAAEVTVIRGLLADVPRVAEEPWLVLFPPQSDEAVLLYVRYQLAHLEYPRRVDVAARDAAPAAGNYAGIITAPGLILTGSWKPTAESGGFTRHGAAGS